jgi:hypothetical protein
MQQKHQNNCPNKIHYGIHWLELAAVLTACGLSIVILYKIFVAPSWSSFAKLSSTLSWTSLVR